MITMPRLKAPTLRRKSIWKFSGLDCRPAASDGAVRGGRNISAAGLPCLQARPGRETVASYPGGTDLIAAHGAPAVINGTDFIYDGVVCGQVRKGMHKMAVMGTKIVVFPEKVFYDIASQTFGALEARVSGAATFGDHTLTLAGEGSLDVLTIRQAACLL